MKFPLLELLINLGLASARVSSLPDGSQKHGCPEKTDKHCGNSTEVSEGNLAIP